MVSLRYAIAIAVAVSALLVTISGTRADEPDVEVLQTLLARLQQVDFQDADAVYDAAEWSREQGLTNYADELYRRALDADPDHQPSHERLRELAGGDGLAAPDADADLHDELADEFPDFQMHATDHFLIVHDTGLDAVRERAQLLEHTHQSFYRSMERAELQPRPLRRRLVVVLFADRDDFHAYSRDVDHVQRDWSLGHYSARTNRIAFFHEPAGETLQRYTRQVEQLQDDVRELEQAVRTTREAGDRAAVTAHQRDLRRARSELARLRARHNRLAEATDAARTTHEASHQLAFNTGILRRGVAYPLWLVEGMATNFEAPRPNADFGPHADNPYRHAAFVDARRRGALLSLDELITRIDPPDDPLAVGDLYAQAWALFRHLYRRHPDQLRAYLAELYTLEPGEKDADALRDAFISAFGDLDTLERRLRAFVHTP